MLSEWLDPMNIAALVTLLTVFGTAVKWAVSRMDERVRAAEARQTASMDKLEKVLRDQVRTLTIENEELRKELINLRIYVSKLEHLVEILEKRASK